MANATRSAAVALSAEWAAAQRSLSSEEQQLLRVQLCPINLGGSSLNCVGSGGCGGGLTFGAATAAGAGVSELIAHSLWLGAGSGASVPTASAAAGDNSISPAASGTPFISLTADMNLSSLSPPTGAARCALLGEQPAELAQFAFNYQSPPPLTAARAYYAYSDYSGVGHVSVNGGSPLTPGWRATAKEPAGVSGPAATNAGALMCPPAMAIARQQQQSCGGGAPGAPINPGATGLLALVPSTTCSLSNGHDAPTFTTAQTDRSSLRTPHYDYANSLYLNSATSRQNDIFALNPNHIDHNSTSNCSKSELRKELNDQLEYSMPKEEKVAFVVPHYLFVLTF